MQRQILFTIFSRGSATVLNFLLVLLVARFGGPAVKGEVTLFITTIWFFVFFSNILGGHILIYLVPRNRLAALVFPAYCWSVIITLLGYGLLKANMVKGILYPEYILMIGFLSSIITIHQTLLFAHKKVQSANWLTLILLFVQVPLLIWFYRETALHPTLVFIYSMLPAYLLAFVVSIGLLQKIIPFSEVITKFSWLEVYATFKNGVAFQLIEILQLLNLRLYFYQLGLQQGAKYLGVFSVGISVLEAVWIIPRSIATVNYIKASNGTKIGEEVERVISLLKITLSLCAVGLFIIYICPTEWYGYVFGEGFANVKHGVRFLFPGIWVYSALLVISSFYLGTGQYKPLLIAHSIGVIVLLIASYMLIPQYVLSGAGLAATLSFVAATLMLSIYFVWQNNITWHKFFSTSIKSTFLK